MEATDEVMELSEQYLEIKQEISQLNREAKDIGDELIAKMIKADMKLAKTDAGRVLIAVSMRAVYSAAFNDRLARLKEIQEIRGDVTFKSKPYLTHRIKKKKTKAD